MKSKFLLLTGLLGYLPVQAGEFKKVEGTFSEISSGDFTHLEILDKKNKLWEFWCGGMPLSPPNSKTIECSDILVAPQKYENKRLLVEYKEIESFVQEAQEKIKRNEVEKIYVR